MTATRFPDAPPQIAALKVEARGYPTPWFVSYVDGEPEFRAVDPRKIHYADKHGLCWICGRPFAGSLRSFTIGPMCAVNRVSPEPPQHKDCARFAAVSCPFLSRPMAKRRPINEGGYKATAGIMIERNPGVTLVWDTRSYRTMREGDGLLFFLGPPVSWSWYAEGREATRDEIMESIRTGLPLLAKEAAMDGPEALDLLEKQTRRAMKMVPEEAA
jgi:hypothetical protein